MVTVCGRCRGVDRAGRDRHHPDPARCQLDRPAAGQRLQRGLGRRVDRAAGPGPLPHRRTHIDDHSAGRLKGRQRGLRQQDGGDQGGGDLRHDRLRLERAEGTAAHDTGIVDQHVQPAVRLQRGPDDQLGSAVGGDVGGQRGDPVVPGGGLVERFGPSADREDVGALGGEGAGGRPADPGAGPGDDDDRVPPRCGAAVHAGHRSTLSPAAGSSGVRWACHRLRTHPAGKGERRNPGEQDFIALIDGVHHSPRHRSRRYGTVSTPTSPSPCAS